MTYFDNLSQHQQAFRAKREQQYQQALDCIKEAGLRGIHKKGVHRATGIREPILNKMIDDMHARKLIHIAGWTMERSTFTALLAIGNAQDAPRVLPKITKKAERQKERRQGTVAMTEEEQLMAAVERKHLAWAKKYWPQAPMHRRPAGEYTVHTVQWIWDAWNARANHSEDARAMVASQSAEPVAWLHESDPSRVISAAQKAQALRDGGASASSIRPYSLACYAAPPAATGAQGLTREQVAEIDDLLRACHRWHAGDSHAKGRVADARAILAQAAPSASAQQVRDVVTRDDVVRWAKFAGIEPFLTERGYERLADFAIAARRAAAPAPSASPAALTDEREALQHVVDCWEAAEVEGLAEAIQEAGPEYTDLTRIAAGERLADLLTRRISFGIERARSILAASPAKEDLHG